MCPSEAVEIDGESHGPWPRLDAALADKHVGPRIFDRFLEGAHRRPDATAIVHARGSWTFAQVDAASQRLAIQLLDMAPDATDQTVALYARRSGELVIAMLACGRAGLPFGVLDAGYPVERLQLLLGVLKTERVVAIGSSDETESVLAQLALPASVLRLDHAAMSALLSSGGKAADARVDHADPGDTAYLLFTSGTTGVPKCIATSHTPLVHFIAWYEREFAVDTSSRFSMLSGLGHDPVLRDVFVPLSTGAELHVPAQPAVLDPSKLYAFLDDARITHAHVTPQLSRIVVAGRRDPHSTLAALRFVFSGGDALRSKQANDVLAIAPSAKVVNFYGSTETPQAMAFHVYDPRADAGAESVPIGRGIDDVQLFVLAPGETLELATANTRGQIAIRTRYLSEGYRGDPALTNKKFVANPRSTDPTDRLYLTGDVGHWRSDATVVIEGRLDDQVKIRGFRVELGDVVAQLQRISHVKEAVVLAEKLADGESRLVAYVVGADGAAAGPSSAVRDAMMAAVPPYMVPARYVWLARFPLLPNGKIDRGALAATGPVEAHRLQQSLDPIEAAIALHWRELLAQPNIDADASFVDLGGDSLSFIEASVKLEQLLGHLPHGWERLSIRALAAEKQDHASKLTSVDSSVLLRAISIVAVVAGHYELPNLAGSVIALFMVSGMSFGRYLVPPIARNETTLPILKLIAKIAIPAILYSIAVNFAFHLPKWPGVFLSNNLVSADQHVSGIGFWYIDILFQCFIVLAILLSIPPVRRMFGGPDPFWHVLVATLLFDVIAVVGVRVFDTSALYDRVPHQYLGCIFLGWAVLHATTLPRKLVVMAAMIITFADFVWKSEYYVIFPFVATVFLLFVHRVPMPRVVGRVVTTVASASLFIYLIDHQVNYVLDKVGFASHPWIQVVIATMLGVGVWFVWDAGAAVGKRTLAKQRG